MLANFDNLDAKPLISGGSVKIAAQRPDVEHTLKSWIRSQVISAERHAESLRKFREGEYGSGSTAPKKANLDAVNRLLAAVHRREIRALQNLRSTAGLAMTKQNTESLAAFTRAKAISHRRIRLAERIWLFYGNLFAQRGGPFANMLLSIDRIASDCYQACYMGLGAARSIPTPPPFTYVEAGYGPATYRRGVLLRKLGRRANPFPLVKIPHHRLINPWALGAVPHEIGHNLQNDLQLWSVIPERINQRLSAAQLPAPAIRIWRQWHKEIYADLIGVLLIGPAYIYSLMDVVAKSPEAVAKFNESGVHPTSYLRPLISTELLRRIDFRRDADALEAAWRKLYSPAVTKRIPRFLMNDFNKAKNLVVDTICFEPNKAYGNRRLADVTRFRPQDAACVEEAAVRIARGTDPGILPERFFIAAVRVASAKNLATPNKLADNFYKALTRR